MALPPAIENPLVATLEKILANPRNAPVACTIMNGFIALVRGQRAIPSAMAAALIHWPNGSSWCSAARATHDSQELGRNETSRAELTMGRRQWVAASLALASVAFSLCIVWSAHAQGGSLTLVPNTVNMFRDTRGPNNVGVTPGDFFQYGADIQGGSAGASLSAVYPPTGFTDPSFPCAPLAVNAGFCSNSTAFHAGRIAAPWSLRLTRGDDELIVSGPDLTVNDNAILNPVPFATSFGFTAGPTPVTPTLTWIIPAGFVPDGMRINVRDKDDVLGNGTANVIHSVSVAPTATSYSIPAVLTSGRTLSVEGNYAVDFQLVETRNHVPFTNSNGEILRRSFSVFDFTPRTRSSPR